jgi:uncharacterized protein (DUF488 family)
VTGEIFTIGHSTRPLAEFAALLSAAGVQELVDVRSFPRSRRNPQFNIEALPDALAPLGISYRHMKALGGRRAAQKEGEPSPNGYWRIEAFRNYADYALTPAFQEALDELMALARERSCAIMCAEALWWRCHRRIITDYLLERGFPVVHILGAEEREPAKLSEAAVVRADGTLIYPPAQASLL